MSAEKVAALEALLSRVQERREQPGTRLRLAFDAAVPESAGTDASRPATSAVAPRPQAPSTQRLGGAVDQSIPQPTAPDEPPVSAEEQLPVSAESAPEIVTDDAPAVEIGEAELAELTPEEAAELAQLDAEAADVEIVEDDETPQSEPATARVEAAPSGDRAEAASEQDRAIEPPTMPRPDLRATPDDAPSSEVATQPRPEPARPEPARPEPARPEPARPEMARPEMARPEMARPEPATQQRPPISDDAASPSEVETTKIDRGQVSPPPLPQPDPAAPAGPTLASGEVLVQPPASPEPAPTLEVGDAIVKPRRVEPQILLKDNVGEFIAEVKKASSATFGEVLEASLELGVDPG